MYRLLRILLFFFAAPFFRVQASQTTLGKQIPLEIPALLSGVEESVNDATADPVSLRTIAESIEEHPEEPYLLARVVTASTVTGIFFVHYFAAHTLCLTLNTFTENKGSYPLIASGKNALFYNPAKGTYPLTGEHDPFFKNPTNYLPITLGIQFFSCAPGEQRFTYLCSSYDLFINETDGAYWRNYFQANQNDDPKLKKEALETLKKIARVPKKAQFTEGTRAGIPVHLPALLGAQEFLNLEEQDPLTGGTFNQQLENQAMVFNDPYFIARVVTQDDQGRTSVTYVDAHEFNKRVFQPYPFSYPRTAFEENYALLYQIQTVDRNLNKLERKLLTTAPWDPKKFLSRTILYFKYDSNHPTDGFTYLCSHYDLFINAIKPAMEYKWNTEIQEYWENVFYANQNSNEQLKKQALTKLKTAPFQKIDKEIKGIQEKEARERVKIEHQKKLAELKKKEQEERERAKARKQQEEDIDALSLLALENAPIEQNRPRSSLQRALEEFNQQLSVLSALLRR